MSNVMVAWIVLRNMIVESRRDIYESGMASLQHFREARARLVAGQTFTWESGSGTRYLFSSDL